jgi:hypothetical protein
MVEQINRSVGGNCDGAGSDRDMGIDDTARIDPPPPIRPSENPTSAPDAIPSPACIAEIIKKSSPYCGGSKVRIFLPRVRHAASESGH